MARNENDPLTYASAGVNYDFMDRFKRLAQQEAAKTSPIIERHGMFVVELSRGESAFVIDEPDRYTAHVVEGLGTKNLVADEVRKRQYDQSQIALEMGKATGRTYYDNIAQDTVAMIVNDLITVGADPIVVNAYCAVGSSDWFNDEQRVNDLVSGWRYACIEAGATWGGGETPTLSGIIEPNAIDLAGSAYGVIKPKERLTLGDRLEPGDAIMLVQSSGIHANGLTLARRVAGAIANSSGCSLAEAYATELSDGSTFGESLLEPTIIYAGLVRAIFDEGIDIHYMANITGHGWRKLMRLEKPFTYLVRKLPEPQPIFQFLQEQSGNDTREMYGNFNMGAGFALYVPQEMAHKVEQIATNYHGLGVTNVGTVREGPRQVAIPPLNLLYKADTLGVR